MKEGRLSLTSFAIFDSLDMKSLLLKFGKGPFTNYVYKRRGVGGQKKPNLVNVVCERPLIAS